jgi:predicted dehydrogenase
MDPLKVAVVGVGALGRHHARILSQMTGVNLVAVADANASQAQAVAEGCGCEWTADYRSLLTRIEAATIVVPTMLHREVASEFLRRDIPVLVEKPLAAGVADGRALVRLADEHQVALQVGHVERFNPTFARLAELCGAPRYVRAERLSPYAFRSMDIGAVHDLMIHDIDLVLTLVRSTVERVEAFGVCIVGGREDCVQARLTFANGCIADLVANRVCPFPRRKLQVWSEAGCVDADLHHRRVIAFRPGDALRSGLLPFDLARQPGADIGRLKQEVFGKFIETTEPAVSDADALTAELRSFVESVLLHHRPEVDGHDALAALEVAERVLEAVSAHAWDGRGGSRVGAHAHEVFAGRAAA